MDKASEAILDMKPVTFRYKHEIDPKGVPQFGLVAEEVEKVNPALVARDAEGEVYTVRYDAVNAMLLNEFLKEHRTVQEQGRDHCAAAKANRSANHGPPEGERTSLKRANLRRKWSTIPKAAQAAFHNQPSRFTVWRLFVSCATAL